MSLAGDPQGQPGIICTGRESYGNNIDFLKGGHLPSLNVSPRRGSRIMQALRRRDVLAPAAGLVAGFLSSRGIISGQYNLTLLYRGIQVYGLSN